MLIIWVCASVTAINLPLRNGGRNYFPISLGNWHCLVVPCGEQFIADDVAGGLEVGGVFAIEFEDSVEDRGRDAQAGLSAGSRDQVFDQLDRLEHDSLAGAHGVRKIAVFDRVVLRAEWRVGGHSNLDSPVDPPDAATLP